MCLGLIGVVVVAAQVMGCSNHDASFTTAPGVGYTSEHFVALKGGGGHATDHLFGGGRVGDGLLYWHLPSARSGNNVTVRVTVYLGPIGTNDNTVKVGEQPVLFPNYVDGAEINRPSSHYDAILLNRVGGSNVLWECTITTFPDNGRFMCTLARSKIGNVVTYATVQERDSSFDSGRQSLAARFDSSAFIIRTNGKP